MASQTMYEDQGIYRIQFDLDSTKNIAGNYSDVAYSFRIWTDNTSAGYHYRYKNLVKLVINGTTLVDTSNIGEIDLNGGGSYTLASGSIRISHNSDGTKSIPFYAEYNQTQNSDFHFIFESEFDLGTIPRASQPSVSASSIVLGKGVTINTNRASTSFTHTLKYSIGSLSNVVLASGVGASYTWAEVPKALAEQFPKSENGTVTVTCYTYNGSTLIGSKPVTFKVTPSEDMVPTCSFTIAEAATLPEGITGYIKGQSKLKITATAEGSYGSTIKSYKIMANSSTYTAAEVTTGVLLKEGTNTITLAVTDTRGKPATSEVTIEVTDYAAPALSVYSAFRCASDVDETAQEDGAYIAVKFVGAVTSLDGINAKLCTVYYKKTTDTEWQSVVVSLSDYAIDETVIFAADTDYAYNVHIELADSFSIVDYYIDIGSAFTLMDIKSNNKGIAFGKVAEDDGLDVNMDTVVRKTLKPNGGFEYPVLEIGTDMNEVLTPNTYSGLDASDAGYSNLPISHGKFTLEVIAAGENDAITQRLIRCYKGETATCERHYYDGEWDTWVDVVESKLSKCIVLYFSAIASTSSGVLSGFSNFATLIPDYSNIDGTIISTSLVRLGNDSTQGASGAVTATTILTSLVCDGAKITKIGVLSSVYQTIRAAVAVVYLPN